MAQVRYGGSFAHWLKGQPPIVAKALLARIALRTVPLVHRVVSEDAGQVRLSIILSLFRAVSIGFFAGSWPKKATEVSNAAKSAAIRAFAATLQIEPNAASYTTHPDYTADPADTTDAFDATEALNAADAIARAVAASTDDVDAARDASIRVAEAPARLWSEINRDMEFLFRESESDLVNQISCLFDLPLWAGEVPGEIAKSWRDLTADLPLGENWQVWTNWYEDRLVGRSGKMELEREKILIPDENWEKGPTHVNAIIADLIKKHARDSDEVDPDSSGPLNDLDLGPPDETRSPEQTEEATLMAPNEDGQVDVLPLTEQEHLLASAAQRENYDDLREDTEGVLGYGANALGNSLQGQIQALLDAMPPNITDALLHPVWRTGNRLRRTLKAHEAVLDDPDPHPARPRSSGRRRTEAPCRCLQPLFVRRSGPTVQGRKARGAAG